MNISNEKFRVHVLKAQQVLENHGLFSALKDIINKGSQGLILLPEIGLSQF